MNRSNRRYFRPQLQALERRQVLDGAVTAVVGAGGILQITGEYKDNVVAIWGRAVAGEVFVAGGKDAAGRPTTVNGQLAPVALSGVTGIELLMQTGNDKVLVTNMTLSNRVEGKMGFGHDLLALRGAAPSTPDFPLNQGGSIQYGPFATVNQAGVGMAGNDGNDAMRLCNVSVSGSVSMVGGNGNDVFQVDGISRSHNSMGIVALTMGAGNDIVRIKRAVITGAIGDGHDLQINDGGAGETSLVELFDVSVAHRVDIELQQPGNDCIVTIGGGPSASQRFHADVVSIQADQVTVQHADIRSFGARTFEGPNPVAITDAVFDLLSVDLGTNDDSLTLGTVTTHILTQLDGGAGTDEYIDLGGNSLAGLTKTSFE